MLRPAGRANNRMILIVLGSYTLMTVLYIMFFLQPSLKELATLSNNIKMQQTTLTALTEVQQRHMAVTAQYEEALAQANELYSRFPREADVPRLLGVITSLTQSNGASQEQLIYSKPEWKDGLGRLQINARFSGAYRQLAKLVVQLPQALPSAYLEEVRFNAVLKGSEPTSSSDSSVNPNAREAGGLFPGLANSPFTSAITNALGLSTPSSPSAGTSANKSLSPLEVDHTEVFITMTVWLLAEDLVSEAASFPLRGWYARQAGSVDLPAIDPFLPSAKARQLVEWRLILDKLQQTQVTGIVAGAGRTMASLQVMGASYTVGVGDKIPVLNEAKVVAIQGDKKQVILDIGGQRFTLTLGGTAK